MLKAKATTDTFFIIGRVILSINNRHISPCNSLQVYLVSMKSMLYRLFVLVRHEVLNLFLKLAKFGLLTYIVSIKVGQLNRRLTSDV